MADANETAILPGHRTGDNEGGEHLPAPPLTNFEGERYISKAEARGQTWLRWKSRRREHGLKIHKVDSNGNVRESRDPEPEPRRKPKGVSWRQWFEHTIPGEAPR